MNTQVFPHFEAKPSCANALDPEMWFPEEIGGASGRGWSRVPSAIKAREICNSCAANSECKEYSLQFHDLTGIWAGLDRMERAEIQERLHLETVSVRSTIPSTVRDYEMVVRDE